MAPKKKKTEFLNFYFGWSVPLKYEKKQKQKQTLIHL